MRYFNLIKSGVNKVLDKTIGVFEMAVLGIIVVSALSYALAWQAPSQIPPAGNVGAPINVGLDAQVKGGNLVVNALGITASGNALLVQNGNVGIGTVNPARQLDIATGPDAAQLGLINTGAGGRRWNIYSQQGGNFHIWEDGAPITRLFINGSNGNVGIGETNPDRRLTVAGEIRATLGTPIYQCPNGDPDWQRNQCMNQLSTLPTCLMYPGGYQAACTLVGRLVAP